MVREILIWGRLWVVTTKCRQLFLQESFVSDVWGVATKTGWRNTLTRIKTQVFQNFSWENRALYSYHKVISAPVSIENNSHVWHIVKRFLRHHSIFFSILTDIKSVKSYSNDNCSAITPWPSWRRYGVTVLLLYFFKYMRNEQKSWPLLPDETYNPRL